MAERVCLHILVDGIVQGVGFRYFTERSARRCGLSGWVRNMPDGSVEIEAEGEEAALNVFLKEVRVGPPHAHVRSFRVDRRPLRDWVRGLR